MTWGGAQWLVVFFVALRVCLGMLKLAGLITLNPRPQSPTGEYLGHRMGDAVLLGVLYWGGFFS